METPKTRRGRQSRDAILEAAARLMYERGVRATTLEEILDAAGAGKSQLYHYFSGKEDLAAAALEHQLARVLGEQQQFRLDTWSGLRSWFEDLVAGQQTRDFNGCPIGSLAIEMSAMSDELRARTADVFLQWQTSLENAFETMRSRGLIRENAAPAELAAMTLAAIQGGYLLSSAEMDVRPMALSLKLALAHLRSWRPEGNDPKPSENPAVTHQRGAP